MPMTINWELLREVCALKMKKPFKMCGVHELLTRVNVKCLMIIDMDNQKTFYISLFKYSLVGSHQTRLLI